MLLPGVAKNILQQLLTAEEQGQPITLEEALKEWGSGSTWEDLVDGAYIYRTQQAVTVTQRGKDYLKEG